GQQVHACRDMTANAPGVAAQPRPPAKQQRSTSPGELLKPVVQAVDAGFLGAVLAAIERAIVFEAVADDADAAGGAGRRQGLDGALEAVEGVLLAGNDHVEG